MTKPLQQETQIGWQVFRRLRLKDHWTEDGAYFELVEYEAPCGTCGKVFTNPTTRTAWRKKLAVRRCKRHRRPGKPVDNHTPPVPLSKLPAWAQPKEGWIKTTAERRRYSRSGGVKGSGKPVWPEFVLVPYEPPRRDPPPPQPSYLD
jgi:hypothetical protein